MNTEKVDHQKIVDLLNDLIQLNRDRAEGYKAAVMDVSLDYGFLSLLEKNTEESHANVANLTQAVSDLGGIAVEEGSAMGKLHRSWMKLKSQITSFDRQTALEECIHADKVALNMYENILNDNENPLPSKVRELLLQQRNGIQLDLNQLQNHLKGDQLAKDHSKEQHPSKRHPQPSH